MTRDRVRGLLMTSPVLGAEVDLRYRVLALTIEPDAATHPDPTQGDRRLQVLFHPVGTIAGALVQRAPGGGSPTVLTFPPERLPDIVATLDGPVSVGEPFPESLPDLHAIEARLSLRGMAQVADGHRTPLALALVHDDLRLDLWATFDEVEVRLPDETVVASLSTSAAVAGPTDGRRGDEPPGPVW